MFEQVLIQGGVAGVVVVAWHFFNKASMSAFSEILTRQAVRENAGTELLKQLLDAQDKRAEQQYAAFKEMIETNQHLIGQISGLKHMVATNQSCPVQRMELRK